MKTLTLILFLVAAGCTMSFAQCDKNVVLSSSTTEHLDANGVVQRTDDETAVIELSKTAVTVSVNGEHKITGVIKSESCDWKTAFKDGKSVIKITVNRDGEEKNATFTIEGKDGKVTLLFEMEGMPDDRIRIGIDKFAEKS